MREAGSHITVLRVSVGVAWPFLLSSTGKPRAGSPVQLKGRYSLCLAADKTAFPRFSARTWLASSSTRLAESKMHHKP